MTDPARTDLPPARLSILFARNAQKAAILRTGPVRATALIEWDLRRDTFTLGQWVRHKIYPERSALSPNGRHLITMGFKARVTGAAHPTGFTVLSRMPFFTAQTLMIGCGTWGGGGAFVDDRHVYLRGHSPFAAPPSLPPGMVAVFPRRVWQHYARLDGNRRGAARTGPKGTGPKGKARGPDDAGRFVLASGAAAPICASALDSFDAAHPPDRDGAPQIGLAPLPEWCVVRDGCLFRRGPSGREVLLKDFNPMRFSAIPPRGAKGR